MVGRAIIPIYEAGDVYARVRQAKQNHLGILQQIEQVRTEQTQNVVAAWSQLEAARAQLQSDRVAVESNKVALQGVREEEKVGQRTLLDVLNAELEYLNSQVNLETTRRNLVVAAYAVIGVDGTARCRVDRRRRLRLRSQRPLQGSAAQVDRPLHQVRRRPRARRSRPPRRPPSRAGTRLSKVWRNNPSKIGAARRRATELPRMVASHVLLT